MNYFDAEELRQLHASVVAGLFWQPRMVRFNLLERCNWRCQMCAVDKVSPARLSVADWTKIARTVIEMGCREISFSGGEPTLYPGFLDLLASLRGLDPRESVKLKLLTNGTLLTSEQIERYLHFGLRRYIVSLHSSVPARHDAIVGRQLQWQRTVAGIARLTARRPAPTVWIACVVRSLNLDDLPGMVRLTAELGCGGVSFSLMDRRVDDPGDEPLSIERMRLAREEILPEVRRLAAELGVGLFPANGELFGTTPEQMAAYARGEFSAGYYEDHACYWPFYHLNIAPDGRVHPCCYRPIAGGYGNVLEEGVEKAIAGPTLRAFLGHLVQRPAAFQACRNCEMKLQVNRSIHDALVQLGLPPRPQ